MNKDWVLYMHRWGITVAVGCYATPEDAQASEHVSSWDVEWNQTHETGFCGYAEHLPLYPRMGEFTPYFTLNRDGEMIFRLMNPVESLKLKQAAERGVLGRLAHWLKATVMDNPDWRTR